MPIAKGQTPANCNEWILYYVINCIVDVYDYFPSKLLLHSDRVDESINGPTVSVSSYNIISYHK